MISRKFLNKVDTYVIGHCGSEIKLNVYQSRRDDGVLVDKIEFGIESKEVELHDIFIHLKFTSYHNKSRQSRIRIPSSIDDETNELQYTNITPVLDTMILKLFIVEICLKDAAKDKDMAI
ncbi:22514_t:CDS:2, partial [Dentiscutata erythropus]